MRALRLIWPWARPYWRHLTGALVFSLVSVLINLMIPLLTSRIIDDGIAADDSDVVLSTGLLMLGLIVIGVAVSAISTVVGVALSFNTITDLRGALFAHTQSLSFRNLDQISSGELLTRLTSDLTRVGSLIGMGVSFLSQIPILFIGSLVAVLAIDPSLVVIVAFMVPLIAGVVGYTIMRSNVLYDAVQSRIDRLNTVLQETIGGAEVVKAFVRQDHEVERIDQVVTDLETDAARVNRLVASLFPTLVLVSSLGIAAVLWLGGISVMAGELTTGELVAFISYLSMVAMPMMMFAFLQPMVSAATASMNRIGEVFATEPDVPEAASAIDLDTVAEPGRVGFDRVSFRYGGDNGSDPTEAICEVSFDIEAGTTVAILGATGSGKSTLVHLIPRFYDASAGTVSLGGIDVRDLTKDSVRRHVSVALQQPHLFSGTVADNVGFARPEATRSEIVAACEAAQAAEFIEGLDGGYDAVIEQMGANLSGGQRQRLALARALLADPSVLILDDSTSAVDVATEARIQEAFADLADMTVILVAQRISTALGADTIILLDRGRVLATGSHDELLATSEMYRDIYRSQLGEGPHDGDRMTATA